MNRFFLIALLTAAAVISAGIGWDWHARDVRQREAAAEEALIERELDRVISLRDLAPGNTLEIVLGQLAGKTEVPLACKWPPLDQYSTDRLAPTEIPAADLSLESALNLVCRQHGLGWYVANGKLVITSEQDAEIHLTTRVYPLPPIADPEYEIQGDADQWIDLITTVIEPDSWVDVGGSASIEPAPGALAIQQTTENHRKIRRLINHIQSSPRRTGGQDNDWLLALSSRERAIHTSLSVTCDYSCTGLPLDEVIGELAQRHHLPMMLEYTKLEEASISPQMPVTVSLRGTTLRSVLRTLLSELGLTYIVRNDVLQITTPEDACCQMRVVAYDVRELVDVPGYERQYYPGFITQDYDSLIDLISTTIDPDSWDDVGGPGSITALPHGWIIFSQTDETHEKTADLLARLREGIRPDRTGPREIARQVTPAETKVRAALEANLALDYSERTLADIAQDLSTRAGINVRLKEKKLDEASIGPSQTVTCKVPPLPLRSGLNRLLDSIEAGDLAWIIEDDSLVFTTTHDAHSQLDVMILDVRDLVDAEDVYSFNDDGLSEAIERLTGENNWEAVGGPGNLFFFRSLLVVLNRREVNQRVKELVEALVQKRDAAIAPQQDGQQHEPRPPKWIGLSAEDQALIEKLRGPAGQPDSEPLWFESAVGRFAERSGIPLSICRRTTANQRVHPLKHVPPWQAGISRGAAIRSLLRDQGEDLTLGVFDHQASITIPGDPRGQLLRIYPVTDLLVDERPEAIDELLDAVTTFVTPRDWTGGLARIVAAPPGALAIADTLEGHERVEAFLWDLRRNLRSREDAPPHVLALWQARDELNRLRARSDQDLNLEQTPAALAGEISRHLGRNVRVAPDLAVHYPGDEKIAPLADNATNGSDLRTQLATVGISLTLIDETLSLSREPHEDDVQFISLADLLRPRGEFAHDELEAALGTVRERHAFIEWNAMLLCGHVIRYNPPERDGVERQIEFLRRAQRRLPHAEPVFRRRDAEETKRLLDALLHSIDPQERLYLEFVLRFSASPGPREWELLSEYCARLQKEGDLELRPRLVAVLVGWMTRAPQTAEQLFNHYLSSKSPELREALLRGLASRPDGTGVELLKAQLDRPGISEAQRLPIEHALAQAGIGVDTSEFNFRLTGRLRKSGRYQPPWRPERARPLMSGTPGFF